MILRSTIKYGLLSWILVAVIGGLVYWGNGNTDPVVQVPQVTVIHDHTQEIEDLKRQVTDRDHLIAHLKTQIKTRNYVIAQYETQLRELHKPATPQPVIYHELKQTTMTEKGFRHEANRVLGGYLDVSRIRVQ